MSARRYFRYEGPEALTRGDYGEGVRGGHTNADYPDMICVFDSLTGDQPWISIDAGLACGEWTEVSAAEHAAL